jgi:hypothetical protein
MNFTYSFPNQSTYDFQRLLSFSLTPYIILNCLGIVAGFFGNLIFFFNSILAKDKKKENLKLDCE